MQILVCECGDSLDANERCPKCGKLGKPQTTQTVKIYYSPGKRKQRGTS